MLRHAVWWVLRVYQLTLSSLIGRQCRFEPTCSHYAQDAVMRFGVVRGGWLSAKRVGRCGPFGGSGFDPVPETLTVGAIHQKGKCGCGGH